MDQTSKKQKPLASISLDLDNLWSYMKTYGETGWEKYPSFFDILIPYVLDVLDRHELKITFFVVGKDASHADNADFLMMLAERGHEIGNHSYNHEPWLHLYSRSQIEKEIRQTEELLIGATEQKPVGFRGPGFSWNKDLLELLLQYNYLYDATSLPTFLGPLARAYYFRNPRLTEVQKDERRTILGSYKEGKRPIKPYFWQLSSNGKLLEIPVTTIPFIKTPFHLSYLLFLNRFSRILMVFYLKIAVDLCLFTKSEISFIIHPTDLLSKEQVPAMRFFPGMDLRAEEKLVIFENVISFLSKHFTLTNMRSHAQSILIRDEILSLPCC